VRCLHVLVAVASKRVTGLVIGEEKNDIGPVLRSCPKGKEEGQKGSEYKFK
jgi:hypothetical protein